jgi:lipoprotein signal peptidase
MVVFFARSGSRHPILPVALGLLIGGSASNLLDRVRL